MIGAPAANRSRQSGAQLKLNLMRFKVVFQRAVDCVGRLDNADTAFDTTEYGLILDLYRSGGRGFDLLKRRRKSGDRHH